jgi:hypothetical protein
MSAAHAAKVVAPVHLVLLLAIVVVVVLVVAGISRRK